MLDENEQKTCLRYAEVNFIIIPTREERILSFFYKITNNFSKNLQVLAFNLDWVSSWSLTLILKVVWGWTMPVTRSVVLIILFTPTDRLLILIKPFQLSFSPWYISRLAFQSRVPLNILNELLLPM